MTNEQYIAVRQQPQRQRGRERVGRAASIVVLTLSLCGCATHYDITMGNGDVVRSRTKPKLNDHGEYVYQDLAGKEGMVNKLRVRQIEPVRRGSQPTAPF